MDGRFEQVCDGWGPNDPHTKHRGDSISPGMPDSVSAGGDERGRRLTRRGFLGRGVVTTVGGLSAVGGTSGAQHTYLLLGERGRTDLSPLLSRHGFSVERTFADGTVLTVTAPANSRRRLRRIAGVVDAVRDAPSQPTPAAPTAREVPTGCRTEPATRQWDKVITDAFAAHGTATGAGTTVAVIDTGILATHPDLEPNFDRERSRRVNGGELHRGRGEDGVGHGTFVAGVAAASDDRDAGIVGMAPDATLVSVSPTLGVTALQDIAAAMEYAARIGVDAMNLSLGVLLPLFRRGTRFAKRLIKRLSLFAYPATAVVIAAGNDARNVATPGPLFDFPASIPSALTVGATGPNDRRAYYSTYGRGFVDIAAPGGGYGTAARTYCAPDGDGDDTGTISAEVPEGGTPDVTAGAACPLPSRPYPTNGIYGTLAPESQIAAELDAVGEQYAYLAGTSFAAPQVAGAVALVREVAPGLSAQQVGSLLVETAEAVQGDARAAGWRRVDAAAAVEAATERDAKAGDS